MTAMMLHRHFEAESTQNITKLEDLSPKPKEETAPPEDAPKRRGGRPKKTGK